jgi:hypothetical protein
MRGARRSRVLAFIAIWLLLALIVGSQSWLLFKIVQKVIETGRFPPLSVAVVMLVSACTFALGIYASFVCAKLTINADGK